MSMIPEHILTLYPDFKSALLAISQETDNMDACSAFFWHIYEYSKNKELDITEIRQIAEQVDSLERKLKNELQTKIRLSDIEESTGYTYYNIAGALILLFEIMGEDSSERYREILTDFEKFEELNRKKTPLIDYYSSQYNKVLTIVFTRLYCLKDKEGLWIEALGALALGELHSYSPDSIDVFSEISIQSPVDTFEKIWDHPSKVENWAFLTKCCEILQDDETLLYGAKGDVEWKGETQEVCYFWQYATGLCTGRLSLTEYRKLRESDELKESETRLKTYFFYDCWYKIPEALQDELKAMDRLWFTSEKINLGGILESLKIVTEHLLRQTLWNPFIRWRGSVDVNDLSSSKEDDRKFEEKLKRLSEKNFEPSIRDFAEMLKLRSFDFFMQQNLKLEQKQREFCKGLSKYLWELNDKRVPRAHISTKDWGKAELMPLFKKYLGIEEVGILPSLARMLKDINNN
jgi:hypothetical protein